jgi:hypothetical protein
VGYEPVLYSAEVKTAIPASFLNLLKEVMLREVLY